MADIFIAPEKDLPQEEKDRVAQKSNSPREPGDGAPKDHRPVAKIDPQYHPSGDDDKEIGTSVQESEYQDNPSGATSQNQNELLLQKFQSIVIPEVDSRRREDSERSAAQPNPSEQSEMENENQHAAAGSNSEAEVISVYADKCTHELAKMRYKSRKALANIMDTGGINELLLKLLKSKDVTDIWRACNGGDDPALGLMFHLGQWKLMTLKEFTDLAIKADCHQSVELVEMLKKFPEEMENRLDSVQPSLLLEIASKISAKPYPVHEQRYPLWKGIADEAGIGVQSINNLNMPAIQGQQRESMTFKFIEIVNQRYLDAKFAWLAEGLGALGRYDVLSNEEIFGDCINCGCVKVPKKNVTK